MKLTKKELKEPMFKTWGRIRTAIEFRKEWERIDALLSKFQQDLDQANIEPNYFK